MSLRLITATRALLVSILAALLVAVPATVGAGTAAADAVTPTGCTPYMAYLVPGTWETNPGADPTRPIGMLGPVGQKLKDSYGSQITVLFVNYSASAFDKGLTYTASEANGVQRLRQLMARCPAAESVLGGYSQGADVAGDVAWQASRGQGPVPASQISAVGLVADPKRGGAQQVGPNPGGHGIAGTRPGGFGVLTDRVREICVPGDLYCAVNSSKDSFLAGLGRTLGSGSNGETGTPTQVAAATGDPTTGDVPTVTGSTITTTAPGTAPAVSTSPPSSADALTSDYSGADLAGVAPMATDLAQQVGALRSQGGSGQLTSGAQATQLASLGSMATKIASSLAPVADTQKWVASTPGAQKYLQAATPDSTAGKARSLLSTFDAMNVPAVMSTASSIAGTIARSVGSTPAAATAAAPQDADTTNPQGAGEGSASPATGDALPGTTTDTTSTGTDPTGVGTGSGATGLDPVAAGTTGSALGAGTGQTPDLGALASSAATLVSQVAPLNATDKTNLTAAASILGVLKPDTVINQGLNVVSAVAGTDYQGIVANLAALPQTIFRGDIAGAHRIAGDLNNQFRPWVVMASKIDFATAAQIVGMIPDTSGVAPIASLVLGLLGNLDIIRLARDVGQIQEVAWQVLQSKNLFALTQLLPIGLDLASVALGVLEPGAKMSPAMLGAGATPAQQQLATAAQGQDTSSMFGSLTQLVSSQGAQDLSKLVGEGLTAASFYASGTHGSYNKLLIDGKNALQWLVDFFVRALGG